MFSSFASRVCGTQILPNMLTMIAATAALVAKTMTCTHDGVAMSMWSRRKVHSSFVLHNPSLQGRRPKKNESLNVAESVLEHLRPQLNKMCNEGSGSSSLATSNSLSSKVCDGGDSRS